MRATAAEPDVAAGLLLPLGQTRRSDIAWLRRLEATAPAGAPTLLSAETWRERIRRDPHTIAEADVAQLAAIEALLTQARAEAAQLHEASALARLIDAEQRIQHLLHVPGIGVFAAEVHTALGLVAAQAGQTALAEASLRRAAVLDAARGVRAAETTPDWHARAQTIASAVATAPLGEVLVTCDASGAQVYLDETLQGATPITVRGVRGVHLLRVEAPGRQAFGALLPIDPGARPPVHVELADDPVISWVNEVIAAANRAEAAVEVAKLLAQAEAQALGLPFDAVWLLHTGAFRGARALVRRCTSAGCDDALRLEQYDTTGDALSYARVLDPAGLGRDRQARDQAWVDAAFAPSVAPAITETPRWWERWYVWTAATVALGTAVGLGVAASSSEPEPRLRVTVTP